MSPPTFEEKGVPTDRGRGGGSLAGGSGSSSGASTTLPAIIAHMMNLNGRAAAERLWKDMFYASKPLLEPAQFSVFGAQVRALL